MDCNFRNAILQKSRSNVPICIRGRINMKMSCRYEKSHYGDDTVAKTISLVKWEFLLSHYNAKPSFGSLNTLAIRKLFGCTNWFRFCQNIDVLFPCIKELPSSLSYKTHLSRQLNCWPLRCSWSIACRRCSNYIFILYLTPGFNRLGEDTGKTRRESFKLWELVRLILESLR